MKKRYTIIILFFLLFASTLVLATDNETTDQAKIEQAFDCLEEKAKDCSGLTTQEVALTILATPDNIFDDCVDELQNRESSDNWGNVRDTALAILALKHAGKNTEGAEEWLIKQNQTPTDLTWYLQQDSNEETECHIGYDGKDFTINIGTDKKIDEDAGSCLTRAQSNFWLQVNENCYDKKFIIECNKDFMANLIYRNKNSPIIYVLEGTESSPAFGSIELEIKSKCFGDGSCNYESTIWATLALLKTGHNVAEFIPYVIAMSNTNERYLPEAFIYMLTNYEDYASSLIESQKLGNYWEAESSAYNRYYDTSLALIALASSNAEQITNAKNWLFFSQGSNGCWQNSIRETAIALWALEGKTGKTSTGSSVTYCTEAGYFCIPATECPSSEDVGDNYFCPSLSDTCCLTESLKRCSEYGGQQCSPTEVCTGNSRKAIDTDTCCTGSCQERPPEDQPKENECEANFYTCMDACSEFQEPMPTYACDEGQVCCRTKTTAPAAEKTLWWIYVLVVLIVTVLVAIAYVYKEQLKLYWFQIKSKFKKDKGEKGFPPRGPRFPPRPGFPPVRRPRPPVAPIGRKSYEKKDHAMSETFRKLKEMSR
ncbi:hypothetical protein KAT36_01595 [Candidatus Pacearchaeota archaeon]|nr:hypothetical protein [Candidatus Pacearchaeota archaeon]